MNNKGFTLHVYLLVMKQMKKLGSKREEVIKNMIPGMSGPFDAIGEMKQVVGISNHHERKTLQSSLSRRDRIAEGASDVRYLVKDYYRWANLMTKLDGMSVNDRDQAIKEMVNEGLDRGNRDDES